MVEGITTQADPSGVASAIQEWPRFSIFIFSFHRPLLSIANRFPNGTQRTRYYSIGELNLERKGR